MDATELKELIDAARRSGAKIDLAVTQTTVTIDFGEGEASLDDDDGVASLPEPQTPIEAAERVTEAIRLDQWAEVLPGIGISELERAAKADALEVRRKGEGADHNAKVADPEDVLSYVRTCESVQAGQQDRPDWWNLVRKQGNAIIRAG